MKVLVVLFFSFTLTGCGPLSTTNPGTQKIIDKFFTTYASSGHKIAVPEFLRKNRWVTNEDANSLVIQMDQVIQQLGKYEGQEKIGENTYGECILQYVYLAKYERQPLKFIFRFYKARDTWQVQSFNYETDFMKELDQAGKAN